MADIVQEVVARAAKRGYTFSPPSLSGLTHDFPKIEKLSALSHAQRELLYDLILNQVEVQIGPPPRELHEDSIPNAATALSGQFQARGMQQFNASAEQIIKDCCPYC